MTIPMVREAQEQARARTLEKQEQLCELSCALAVLASASSVSREREEFLRLVNKEIELYNSMVEKEGIDGEEDAMKAYRAAHEQSDQGSDVAVHNEISSALIDRVDAMLQNLEKEIDDVDAKIGDRWRLLDRDYDGKVTPEEVASAAMYLKDTLGKEGVQELISNLSKDRDGKILVEDIVKLGSRAEDAGEGEGEGEGEDSRFTQQELPACKPILTPRWVISAFMLVSIVFIPIGVASLFASRDVVEIVDRYETECIPPASRSDKIKYIQSQDDKTCNRTLTVPKRMKQPIYVYYQLDNFYQNHRRYVKSRSDQQLKYATSVTDTSTCKPEDTANGASIVPCGLIAWSLFNDTYSFSHNNQQLAVKKKGISWKSDREHKFGKDVYPKNFQNGTLKGGGYLNSTIPLSDQEDLIVWMRTAALPTFRKLYGKIEVDLEENDVIQVTLKNNYNTYSFNGKKRLVLSTTTWLGGKNDFLGIAYLTVGAFCFFLAMTFTVVYLFKPSKIEMWCSHTSLSSWEAKK